MKVLEALAGSSAKARVVSWAAARTLVVFTANSRVRSDTERDRGSSLSFGVIAEAVLNVSQLRVITAAGIYGPLYTTTLGGPSAFVTCWKRLVMELGSERSLWK